MVRFIGFTETPAPISVCMALSCSLNPGELKERHRFVLEIGPFHRRHSGEPQFLGGLLGRHAAGSVAQGFIEETVIETIKPCSGIIDRQIGWLDAY